jgi:hypothetical protein
LTDFDPQALFERLASASVEYVVIGGWAVNAHGHRRLTADLDICPDPDRENLRRLANVLAELHAEHLGAGDFEADEIPGDPTDADSLAAGGNFRVMTDLGVLDVMQWVPGIEAEQAYEALSADALEGTVFGVQVRVCSRDSLAAMKRAAGRAIDLEDLDALGLG